MYSGQTGRATSARTHGNKCLDLSHQWTLLSFWLARKMYTQNSWKPFKMQSLVKPCLVKCKELITLMRTQGFGGGGGESLMDPIHPYWTWCLMCCQYFIAAYSFHPIELHCAAKRFHLECWQLAQVWCSDSSLAFIYEAQPPQRCWNSPPRLTDKTAGLQESFRPTFYPQFVVKSWLLVRAF